MPSQPRPPEPAAGIPLPAAGRLRRLAVVLVALLAVGTWSRRGAIEDWWYGRMPTEGLVSAARRNPGRPDVRRLAGERLLDEGRPVEAWGLLGPLARERTEDAAVLTAAARAAWQTGEPAEASRLFDRAMALVPTSGTIRYRAGEALAASGRPEDARGLLEQAVALDPALAPAWVLLAELELEAEHAGRALRALESAAKTGTRRKEVPRLRARALLSLGRPEEAAQAARRAVRLAPDAAAYLVLGEALLAAPGAGGLEEARAVLERAAALAPGEPAALKQLALAHRALGDHRAAVRVLRALLRRAPGMAEGYHLLGQSYLALRQAERAAACQRAYRRLEPLETRLRQARYRLTVGEGSLPVRLELARAYQALGRQDLARRTLEAALRQAPGSLEAQGLLRRAQGPATREYPALPPDPEGDAP